MTTEAARGDKTWTELAGNLHMHTVYSDGAGTHDDLVAAARANGLQFIIATDHNCLVSDKEGWHGDVLLLVGQEVHDVDRLPTGNHLLVLGVARDVTPHAADPQQLIDAVNAQAGLAFLAHPFERASTMLPDTYPWWDWEVTGYTGLELWNYMAEFRVHATNKLSALAVAFLPQLFSRGPWPETLARWDELLVRDGRTVVAVGGSDAHAHTYTLGPIRRTFLPYRDCFAAVNTHILTDAPLRRDLHHDRAAIYRALKAGHAWIGYDLAGSTAGFRFRATNGKSEAVMGDRLVASEPMTRLEVDLPLPAEIRLLRDGRIVARESGTSLAYATHARGIYRVEVWRRFWGRPRGWIFSNPIYVE